MQTVRKQRAADGSKVIFVQNPVLLNLVSWHSRLTSHVFVASRPSACKQMHVVYERRRNNLVCVLLQCCCTQRPLVDAKAHQTVFMHTVALNLTFNSNSIFLKREDCPKTFKILVICQSLQNFWIAWLDIYWVSWQQQLQCINYLSLKFGRKTF